uniref:Uncharacterized protein n=1 Tax=Apis cerana TaxID=7461 RepID=V9IFU0_APICE
MGKQKRQKNRPHKKNPTGLPSVKDFETEEIDDVTNNDRESALRRVFEEVDILHEIYFTFLFICTFK